MLFIKTNKPVFALAVFIAVGFLFSCVLLNSSPVSAHTLTITTNNSITLDATPNGNGTSIKTESINVASTCRSGYNLSISTPEGSDLYRYDSTNDTFDSTASFTAVDGTLALGDNDNTNKWGFTIYDDPNSNTFFSPLSATPTTLKTYSQTASPSSDINDTFNIYYGVKVDSSVVPGNYQMANHGAIVYYATVEPTCLNYTVQYQDGGADNPNGMGTTDESTGEKSVRQTNIAEGTTITLLPPNFKKQGHSFLGWSTDENAYTHFTDNDNTNDPIIYGPMETVTIDSDIIATANTRNQINMYAIWLPALRTDPSDSTSTPVYFQDWDNPNTPLPHDGCSTLTQTIFDDTETNEKDKIKATKDSVVALTDKRDNQVYTVARLADGKCWMTENLRLDAEYTRGNNINDPTVTNQYLSQGYGGTTGTYGNFVGLADSENANFANTTPNSIYKSSANPPVDTYDPISSTLEDIGTVDSPQYRFPRYNNNNTTHMLNNPTYIESYTNASSPVSSGEYKTSAIVSYGNYYNWAATIASTNLYQSISASEPAGTSLCPAGWNLPTSGNTTKDFGILSQKNGGIGGTQNGIGASGDLMSKRFRAFPNNILYSGDLDTYHGSRSYLWSRSIYSNNFRAYFLQLSNEKIEPSAWAIINNAYSARCIVDETQVEITLNSNNSANATARTYGTPGSSVSLPQASTAEPGYAFKNWNTAPDGSGTTYTTSYTIPASSTGETLYAQWTPQYAITYVNNCMSWASGDANCNQTKSDGTLVQKINLDTSGNGSGTLGAYNKFTMTGWKIKEWTTNADGTGSAYPVNTSYSVTGASAGDSITLYAHWLPVYTVQYDGNGSDNDSTGMGSTNDATGIKTVNHYNVAEGDTFDLFASNFKRNGYGFVGWSLDANAWSKLTDNDTTNDVRIWGPNEIFTTPAPSNNTPIITLYAIWAPTEKDGNNNPIYLQNWTGCSAMTATTYNGATGTLSVTKNSVTALTDQRDGNVYTIAKLADGNCWMVENLRLDNTAELSTTNTNILPTNSTLPITNIYNTDDALATKSNFLSHPSNQNSINDPDYGWCTVNSADCADQSRLNIVNTTTDNLPSQTHNVTSANAHVNFGGPVYSYGNYYNWYSATAGYGLYSNELYVSTDGDLCPAGWHLPYGGTGKGTMGGGTSGGFSYLDTKMNGSGSGQGTLEAASKWRAFPNNFIFSGWISDGEASDRGYAGFYWSSTSNQNTYSVFQFRFYSNNLYPGMTWSYKRNGNPVRCVLSA